MRSKAEIQETVQGYVEYLERGAATHATYAQTASDQAIHVEERLANALGGGSPEVELDVIALRIAVLEVQASVHTAGLSTCLAALAQLAAAGFDVSAAPPLPEVTK